MSWSVSLSIHAASPSTKTTQPGTADPRTGRQPPPQTKLLRPVPHPQLNANLNVSLLPCSGSAGPASGSLTHRGTKITQVKTQGTNQVLLDMLSMQKSVKSQQTACRTGERVGQGQKIQGANLMSLGDGTENKI